MYDTLPLLRASDHNGSAGQGSSWSVALHDSLQELAR